MGLPVPYPSLIRSWLFLTSIQLVLVGTGGRALEKQQTENTIEIHNWSKCREKLNGVPSPKATTTMQLQHLWLRSIKKEVVGRL